MADGYRQQREALVAAGAVEHLVRDMTAIFGADVTLAEAQRKLGEAGQWLPIDGPADASLGKLLDVNSSGPLRLGYGAWRDLLLGCQFVNGRGQLVTAGGVAIKNVAGYDVGKFMVGQSGVFGKVVTLTTRTYARPAGAVIAKLPPDLDLIGQILPTENRPTWAMIDAEKLLLGYLGDDTTLKFNADSVRTLDAAAQVRQVSLEEEVGIRTSAWRVLGPWGEECPVVFRASVPPGRVVDFVRGARLRKWVADPAFGVVIGGCDDNVIEPIRGAAKTMGGGATFRNVVSGELEACTMSQGERMIIDRLKRAFDPEGKLVAVPENV